MANLIERWKHYNNRGYGRTAWSWNYTVKSPNQADAGCFTLDEALVIARKRERENHLPIIRTWINK